MADGLSFDTTASPAWPLVDLSDADLEELLQQQEAEMADMSQLTDEQLIEFAKTWQAPQGPLESIAPVLAEKPAPELSAGDVLAGGARELAGGALFEFADEAEAAARAPFSSESYDDILKDIRTNRALFSDAYPGTAMGLNVIGGVGSMFVPGVNVLGRGAQAVTGISKLASPVARVAASGALAGGAAGAGSGEDMQGRLKNAGTGVVLGAGLGTAAHGVGKGLAFGRDVFTARGAEMSEEAAARQAAIITSRRLTEGGLTPQQAADMWRMEQSYNIPSVFGTTSPELSRLTETVVNTPSGEQAALLRSLIAQQAGAPRRVQTLVSEATNTPDYFDTLDSVQSTLRRRADAAYKKAYAAGDVQDPRIMDFLREPDVQVAYQDALENAARLKAAARLRGEDPSQFDLRQLSTTDTQGNVTAQAVPDIRTLDYVKQAMDRRISSLYSSGQGAQASSLRDMRNAFVDTLDTVGPKEYRVARQEYKGDIEIQNALEAGKTSGGLRWQQFNKLVRGYSPGELEAFKTGHVQNIFQRFENTGNTRNFAKDLLADDQLRKLKAVTGPGEYQVLEAALKREDELFRTLNRTTGGSATYGRAAEKADIDQQIASGNVETALDLVLNPTPGNVVAKGARALSALRKANVSRATYTQLARLLRSGTPDEIDDVVSRLEAAAPQQQAADRSFERATTKAGAGLAKVLPPSPVVPEPEAAEYPTASDLPPLDEDGLEVTVTDTGDYTPYDPEAERQRLLEELRAIKASIKAANGDPIEGMALGGRVQALRDGGPPDAGYDYANAARTFLGGLTFDSADEVEAAARALAAQRNLSLGDLSQRYRGNVNEVRAGQDAYAEENPKTAMGLELAGMLGSSMLIPGGAAGNAARLGARAVPRVLAKAAVARPRTTKIVAEGLKDVGLGALYSAGTAPTVAAIPKQVRDDALLNALFFAGGAGIGAGGRRVARTAPVKAASEFVAKRIRR